MSGKWKGRSLTAPSSPDLRPTLGRVKVSLFSALESLQWKRSGSPDISHWKCLDLFAGVGGLGIEALSRGASSCVFVEANRRHALALRANIESLGAPGFLLEEKVEQGGWKRRGPYDLVLLDPPYAKDKLSELLGELSQSGALGSGAIVAMESGGGGGEGAGGVGDEE
jgi:16S rRNA (guanine966-N2)-methyltransferase